MAYNNNGSFVDTFTPKRLFPRERQDSINGLGVGRFNSSTQKNTALFALRNNIYGKFYRQYETT